MNKQNLLLFNESNLEPSVSILSAVVNSKNSWRVPALIARYVSFFNKIAKYNGLPVALETAKQLSNNVKRDAFGLTCDYTYPIPIRTGRNQLPYALRQFGFFTKSGSTVLKAVAISISTLYRSATCEVSISYLDITTEYGGGNSELYSKLLQFIREDFYAQLRDLKQEASDHRESTDDQEPTIILSASPFGSRSLETTENDALQLVYGPNSDVYDSVSVLYRAFDASHKLDYLVEFSKISDDYQRGPLARYAFVPDKGGKTRGITLGNYFIQDSLKPLHDDLMYCLAKIPEDFTYKNDDTIKRTIVPLKQRKAFCYDMSGATDRFPRKLQSYLLQQFFGSSVAANWDDIMSLPIEHEGNLLRFTVGQPMGLFSSFAAFSLTHHSLIRFCFSYLGLSWKGNYMILGDDIVIFNERAGKLYLRMLNILDVKVSLHKSVLSTDKLYCAEFCKRLFLNGSEITNLGSGLICGEYVLHMDSFISRVKRYDSWGSLSTSNRLLFSSLSSLNCCLNVLSQIKDSAFGGTLTLVYYILLRDDVPKGFRKDLLGMFYLSELNISYLRSYIFYYKGSQLCKLYLNARGEPSPVKKLRIRVDALMQRTEYPHLDFRLQAVSSAFRKINSLLMRLKYLSRAPFINLRFFYKSLMRLEDMVCNLDSILKGHKTNEEVREYYKRLETTRSLAALNNMLKYKSLLGPRL